VFMKSRQNPIPGGQTKLNTIKSQIRARHSCARTTGTAAGQITMRYGTLRDGPEAALQATQIGQRLEKQSAIVLVVTAFARCVAISLAQRANKLRRPLRVGAAGANHPRVE
jgi:hypothetical protein